MYSRFSNTPQRKLQIPEHYDGCAFGNTEKTIPVNHFFEVATPSPPDGAPSNPSPPVPLTEETVSISKNKDEVPNALSPTGCSQPESSSTEAKSFSLLNTLDFDQLLLLGLILLLSHTGEGSDIILWLGLLLFCP